MTRIADRRLGQVLKRPRALRESPHDATFFPFHRCRSKWLSGSIHMHDRLTERGATEEEVVTTVEDGERFQPNSAERDSGGISLDGIWNGKRYSTKRIEAYTVDEDGCRHHGHRQFY